MEELRSHCPRAAEHQPGVWLPRVAGAGTLFLLHKPGTSTLSSSPSSAPQNRNRGNPCFQLEIPSQDFPQLLRFSVRNQPSGDPACRLHLGASWALGQTLCPAVNAKVGTSSCWGEGTAGFEVTSFPSPLSLGTQVPSDQEKHFLQHRLQGRP